MLNCTFKRSMHFCFCSVSSFLIIKWISSVNEHDLALLYRNLIFCIWIENIIAKIFCYSAKEILPLNKIGTK